MLNRRRTGRIVDAILAGVIILSALTCLTAFRSCEQSQAPRDGYGSREAKRSPKWPAVRAAHLKKHPRCEVCKKTTDLEVHHVEPFHLHPEKELDPGNLMTFCRDHHFLFGHLMDWDSYNPNVRRDVAEWSEKIANRPRAP